MVARGMVHEAHASLEALQGRLKEVRDRLDRVSREEAHYLELATSEHKLLQVRYAESRMSIVGPLKNCLNYSLWIR